MLFSVLLYYFRQKNSQNFTRLYWSIFLFTILYSSLTVQVKNISLRWYWNQSRTCSKKLKQIISVCHWNLDSIYAHGYAKVSLLKSYITAHKMDIICLSETYLDPCMQSGNDNLEIPGYNLVRSDHPSDNKRGRVCICYKASLPLRVIEICFLQECITFDRW